MANAENAQAVYDFLTANPKIHDQGNWAAVDGQIPDLEQAKDAFSRKPEKNVCGTTLCAAGAAVLVVGGKKEFRKTLKDFSGGDESYYDDDVWVRKGSEILGISEDDGHRLFYTMDESAALKMLKALAEDDEQAFDAIADEAYEDGLTF